jgi:hypothetical protein
MKLCLTGLITSAGLGVIFSILVPVATSPPEPPGLLHFGITYIIGIFGASIGAALQLPHRQLVFPAVLGCASSLLVLVCLSFVTRRIFPEELRVMEMWEYATIVLAVPVLGFGTWWPVSRMNNRL